MARNVLLCFLTIFLTRIEASHCESYPRYFPVHEGNITLAQVSYPYSDTDCICSNHGDLSFLQCEERFLANLRKNTFEITFFSFKEFFKQRLEITCNKTIASEDLNHDYPRLIGLDGSVSSTLYLKDCPEPKVGFVRQFFPPENEILVTGKEELKNNIRFLDITCSRRETFAILKTHLESLYHLVVLRVSCFALKSLPSDLFQGTTPSLMEIIVERTRLDQIPSTLFSNLTQLRAVHLHHNFIKRISGDAFLGCRNLIFIGLNANRLSHFEDNILGTLENLRLLHLSDNRFTVLPGNSSDLSRLSELDMSLNRLEYLDKERCEGLSNIEILNVSYNGIAYIHPNCLGKDQYILDLSGNALENVTEIPVQLSSSRAIYFRDNSASRLDAKKFFDSEWLSHIYMSNSNVVSIGPEFLHGFPRLVSVDFGTNKISSVSRDTFSKNEEMKNVFLQGNDISTLPSGLFRMNEKLVHLDLSRNRIGKLPGHLFSQTCRLQILDLSFNQIANVPDTFLKNITSLKLLNFSNNLVTSLHKDFLKGMSSLDQLDFSHNGLLSIQSGMFDSPYGCVNLRRLFLQGNNISKVPDVKLKRLEYLDASMNNLESYPLDMSRFINFDTPSLKKLHLSGNKFEFIPLITSFDIIRNLDTLDLSHNKLNTALFPNPHSLINRILAKHATINVIDLSYNQISSFYLEWVSFASTMEKLNLSNNNIEKIETVYNQTILYKLKVLDICNNYLSMKDSPNYFDEDSLSWGLESTFHRFPNLEELYLRNNSISSIFLDWRINMPKLKYLDLRHNKLHFLSHQDLIFKSTADESIGLGPYHWPHKLTVDLRHNRIRFIELPHRMLRYLPQKNETRGAYGHVEMLIEENPFECACAMFNLLSVISYDAVLQSQLRRVTGRQGMFSAQIDVGGLSCSSPESVVGKKLNNTEEWIHHLIPLFGLCTLKDQF